MDVATLNSLDRREAARLFGRCCASGRWVDRMVSARPFLDGTALLTAAEEVWWDLSADDWHESFAAGGSSSGEYEARFGYPYVVFTGNRTDDELMALFRERVSNDRVTELGVTAAEQARATNLALRSLLDLA